MKLKEKKPCAREGCDLPACTKGYCAKHYATWHRHNGKFPEVPYSPCKKELCIFPGCHRLETGHKHHVCKVHRTYMYTWGLPAGVPRIKSPPSVYRRNIPSAKLNRLLTDIGKLVVVSDQEDFKDISKLRLGILMIHKNELYYIEGRRKGFKYCREVKASTLHKRTL